jgi:membrane protease YdiL (CAAX protease family)
MLASIRAVLRQADEQSLHHLNSADGQPHAGTMLVLFTAAAALTAQTYFFTIERVTQAPVWLRALGASDLAAAAEQWITAAENREIAGLAFWAIGRLLCYVGIPLLVIRFLLRQPVADFGVKLRGAAQGWPVYAVMFALLLPAVFYFSRTQGFQETYPFYVLRPGETVGPRLIAWELLYALQFIGLEFFFRGFLLHGTRKSCGSASIFVMMVPYCMIHFGKPVAETCGAIGAGIVLGFMSLKTRSIWMGAAVHIAVAWSMDALSLWHRL